MHTWTIQKKSDNPASETWTYRHGKRVRRFPVRVTLGKPLDIFSLKSTVLKTFSSTVTKVSSLRGRLYRRRRETVRRCPTCTAAVRNAPGQFAVSGIYYIRCEQCGHYFVGRRPSAAGLGEFYRTQKAYQRTYADLQHARERVTNVAVPKVAWMRARYQEAFGRPPKKILDVGAGSGHFVAACRQAGLDADGIELSASGRRFCADVFGIELHDADFVRAAAAYRGYDIITFWGVIEHVAHPVAMLSAACRTLGTGAKMVISEVPRWDCLGTAVQRQHPGSVIRHLDPLGHIHCFTDGSLGTALLRSGLKPYAVWYFGMDVYELLVQRMYAAGKRTIPARDRAVGPLLQQMIDHARLSDTIVCAAVPDKRYHCRNSPFFCQR